MHSYSNNPITVNNRRLDSRPFATHDFPHCRPDCSDHISHSCAHVTGVVTGQAYRIALEFTDAGAMHVFNQDGTLAGSVQEAGAELSRSMELRFSNGKVLCECWLVTTARLCMCACVRVCARVSTSKQLAI